MEDFETASDSYATGFNEGYLIQKYEPDFGDLISKASGESDRLQGMKHGREQLIREQIREIRPSWLSGDSATPEKDNIEKEKDLDMDKDDVEPN